MKDGSSDGAIPTNLRLIRVLEVVAEAGIPVTPTEVNAQLRLPKPTIHRLFATLEAEGFLERDLDGRSYAPGLRMRFLAGSVLSSRSFHAARQAILTRLSQTIGETCNIAQADRTEMMYLDRVETEWPLRIQLPIGTRVPFHCTASGKMYLSSLDTRQVQRFLSSTVLKAHTPQSKTQREDILGELKRVRKQGFAVDREEFMAGMIALAVPIKDGNGRLMATLSFHAPEQRVSAVQALDHLDALKGAAEELADLVREG